MKKTSVCCKKCGTSTKSAETIEGICIPCALKADEPFQRCLGCEIRVWSHFGHSEDLVRQWWLSFYRTNKPTTLAKISYILDQGMYTHQIEFAKREGMQPDGKPLDLKNYHIPTWQELKSTKNP